MDDCSGIPGLSYREFSDWIHKKVISQHIPINGSMEVTMRCNLRCVHCYIPEEQRATNAEPELTLKEIQRVLDEITDAGCLWLLLTGGEPFFRRDFLEIYTYAKRKGLLLTIFTNGTLIDACIADFLGEYRPFKIEITLYGATQETYEKVTGIPGSYSRCRQGIDLLLERKLPLALKTVAMSINKNELDQMASLATYLGTPFKFDPIIDFALDGSGRPGKLRLSPEEIVAIEKKDTARAAAWPEKINNRTLIQASDPHMYLCGAGRHTFHIDAYGGLSPCLIDRQKTYQLRNGSFAEGWQDFLPALIAQEYRPTFSCLGCELRYMCLQCPALAYLERGNNHDRVDFICRVTKLRKSVFST